MTPPEETSPALARAGARSRRLGGWFGAGLGLTFWALLAALYLLRVFEIPDLKFSDWRYRLRGEREASDRIALVEVDDATLREHQGRWPLSRELYALLIDGLSAAGARAIAFDLIFLGEEGNEPDSVTNQQVNLLLAAMTEANPQVVHAFDSQAEEEPAPLDSLRAAHLARHALRAGDIPLPIARSLFLPYPALLDAARALG